ncbi:MAG: 16S rRNA (cytidine(1402)-2'-O)-methyltransferase [Saccharofermentanales bacterium]
MSQNQNSGSWSRNSQAFEFTVQPGTLYLVGTPIGNLGDFSPRAAAVLANVDLIAAEDTRHTLRLLNHFGIRKHMESYHEHNWAAKTPVLIDLLQKGSSLALVSDAGMPCISDPGYELVGRCVELQIPVTVVPGPSAALTGLAASGLSTERFMFEGFIPATGRLRKERIAEIAAQKYTSVIYEAPHRLLRTLEDFAAAGLSARRMTVARELTKWHEEFLRLTVGDLIHWYREKTPRGEYVLVLEGLVAFQQRFEGDGQVESTSGQEPSAENLVTVLLELARAANLTIKDAVRICVEQTGMSRNDVYQQALELWRDM